MSFYLETNRLQLQIPSAFNEKLIYDFYYKNASLFDQYEPTRPEKFYTLSYQKASLNYESSEILKGHTLRYYITEIGQPKRIIGSINFSRIEHGPFSKAVLGYKLDKDYHKMGYATEACLAAIPVIFSNYQIHRIEARVNPDNIPSIKLLERLGFTFEGIEYKSVEINGQYKDHYRYSLLQENFTNPQTTN